MQDHTLLLLLLPLADAEHAAAVWAAAGVAAVCAAAVVAAVVCGGVPGHLAEGSPVHVEWSTGSAARWHLEHICSGVNTQHHIIATPDQACCSAATRPCHKDASVQPGVVVTWKAFLRLMLKALRMVKPSGTLCITPSGAWNSSHILVGPETRQEGGVMVQGCEHVGRGGVAGGDGWQES